ncbi:hypothetical protein ACFXTH_022354 [Malus domestica]
MSRSSSGYCPSPSPSSPTRPLLKQKLIVESPSHLVDLSTISEAAQIARHPRVVSLFLNQRRKLHTTRSWDFLGLEQEGVVPPNSIWKKARYGEDSIIRNLDTGAWPESKSFSDEGYGPIPSKWK